MSKHYMDSETDGSEYNDSFLSPKSPVKSDTSSSEEDVSEDESDVSEDEHEEAIASQPRLYSELNNQLIKFIVHGYHAYKIIQDQGFKELIATLNESISLPSKRKLTSSIQKMYEEKKEEIINIMKEQLKVCLTINFWTSVTKKTYIILTGYFVVNNKLISPTLEFDTIYPYDSDQIMSKVNHVIQEFGLETKIIAIITDCDANATDYKVREELHDQYNVPVIICLAHILNLIVSKGLSVAEDIVLPVQKIVKFITFSWENKQLYKKYCKSLDVAYLPLLQDAPNRWNSTYLMLQRALKMKGVLDSMCTEVQDMVPYTITDWENIEVLLDFLQPFYEAATLLSKHSYPSLCYVIPVFEVLYKYLHTYKGNNIMNQCATSMMAKLNRYSVDIDLAQIATILDPRVKNYYFDKNDTEAMDKLKSYYEKFTKENVQKIYKNDSFPDLMKTIGAQSINEDDNARTSLFDSIYKKPLVLNEINSYINMPTELGHTDILLWWSAQKSLPTLSQMALSILAIPATCIPSEEAFSIQGDIINKKRNQLSSNHMQTSRCLSSWLKVLEEIKQ